MTTRNDELAIVVRAKDFATGELNRISVAFSSFTGRLSSGFAALKAHWVAAAAAFYAVMRTLSTGWDLFEKAAGREDQIEALDRLVAKYRTSANEIVAAIKSSSHGLIDTKTALDSIGDAVVRNLDPRILEKFAAGAVVMAKATGESTAAVYSEIIDAVSTGQARALKRITGVMDMKEIYGDKFAAFSEGQQAALRMELVLKRLTERQLEYGAVLDGTDDQIVRFKNAIADLKNTVGTGLKDLFGVSFADFAKGIDDAAQSLRSFVSENDRLLGAIGGVFQSIGESIANVARTIGIVTKDMGVWQILWTAFTAGLKVANLSIALFADFVTYIKIGLYALGWLLDKLIIAPLRLFASWGADLAEKLGFDKAASGLREFIALSQAGADQVEADLKKMTVDEDPINKNWNRSVEANKALLKVQQEGVKAAQEAKKAAAATFTPPPTTGFSATQKKAAEDFLSWYKTQSAQVAGEIKALHGDEAGALKEQYEKSLEEVAQKARELDQKGLLKEKDGTFTIDPKMTGEGRAKAAEALKAYNDLREKYTTLFHDKEILLQKTTDARIAELSIYDYEAIHKTKLALLGKQLSGNPALLQAALNNENLLYAEANRFRTTERRQMLTDLQNMNLTGSAREVADLKSAYEDDLASFKERVYQKQATWEEYDAYVRTREIRLNEDVKRIQGSFTDGMLGGIREYIDAAGRIYDQGKEFFQNTMRGMEDAVVAFVTTGKASFRDFANSVIADMARIAVKQAVMAPILGGLSSLFGGSAATSGINLSGLAGVGFSGMSNAGDSWFGGAKAAGGDVLAGKTYIVGERGPELFRAGSSGTIVPNHALGGTTSISVTVPVTVVESGGGAPAGVAGGRPGTDSRTAAVLSNIVRSKVTEVIMEQTRPGGLLHRG